MSKLILYCIRFALPLQPKMTYNTFTLTNGLRVIHLPASSPVVYCGYQIAAGTRNEGQEEEGLAHFCEHTTFKGTTRRRAWHILNSLESVGGDLNAFTTKEYTVYYASVLKGDVARAVDLLSDIVFHSVYPQNEIDKEVEVICDEIESYNDSPSELIFDDFENTLFSGHPLGRSILGNEKRLHTFTTNHALCFTRKFYRPSNAVFFLYGDVSFSRLVRLLQRATADVSAAPATFNQVSTPLPPYRPATIVKKKDTHQAHVLMGHPAYNLYDEQRMALYLLSNILGGPGMNSRLNVTLRERKGLVYTVESIMTAYTDTGWWGVYFGCDKADVDRCRKFVEKELQRMVQQPLTASQLKAAQKQLKGQIGVACDNREAFALDFGKTWLFNKQEKHLDVLFQQIDALTPLQLQQAAAEIIAPENLTTLVYQ